MLFAFAFIRMQKANYGFQPLFLPTLQKACFPTVSVHILYVKSCMCLSYSQTFCCLYKRCSKGQQEDLVNQRRQTFSQTDYELS